jgi:hypothetical protein
MDKMIQVDPTLKVSSTDPTFFTPICCLAPVDNIQNITATIVCKNEIRRAGLPCGFSVDLEDGSGSTIRGLFFNTTAKKFDSLLQVNDSYKFCGGTLRGSKHEYDGSISRFELYFDRHSNIERLLIRIEAD